MNMNNMMNNQGFNNINQNPNMMINVHNSAGPLYNQNYNQNGNMNFNNKPFINNNIQMQMPNNPQMRNMQMLNNPQMGNMQMLNNQKMNNMQMQNNMKPNINNMQNNNI